MAISCGNESRRYIKDSSYITKRIEKFDSNEYDAFLNSGFIPSFIREHAHELATAFALSATAFALSATAFALSATSDLRRRDSYPRKYCNPKRELKRELESTGVCWRRRMRAPEREQNCKR